MAGKLIHFEIPAGDTRRATEFYGSLFGWGYQTWDGPMEYHLTEAGGGPGGAVYPRDVDDAASGIRIWFDTDDLDADIAKVRELGGEATDREQIPGIGWFSLCKDTEGNAFGLMHNDPGTPGGQ